MSTALGRMLATKSSRLVGAWRRTAAGETPSLAPIAESVAPSKPRVTNSSRAAVNTCSRVTRAVRPIVNNLLLIYF